MAHVHSDTERARAYRAVDKIKAIDIDARLLTIEQAGILTNWCGWQHNSTFEDMDGNSWPLQAVLDAYHESIVYETFESWYSEEPRKARKAYIAICRKHKLKYAPC